jgi:hypothetical protein
MTAVQPSARSSAIEVMPAAPAVMALLCGAGVIMSDDSSL